MFVGHFAVAFAAKPAAPRASLGWAIAAAQFLDLLWPLLVLAGVERVRIAPGITSFTPLDFEHYPISHSLLTTVVWAFSFGAVYFVIRRFRREALVLGLVVVSHWILDWITHRPDLPLVPGGETRVGLGLWNSVGLTLTVELLLFALGIWVYARATTARDRIGKWGFVALVAFLALIYAGNVFGPPPPSVKAIGGAGLALWLFPLWGWWVDRHRDLRRSTAQRNSLGQSNG